MELMSDERILLTSDTKEVNLTTHRIRFQTKQWGRARVTSIMLEELCSCEIRYASNPILLIIAAILILLGITVFGDYAAVGYIGGVILAIAYFLTRRSVISLASGGASIHARTSGMSLESATKFVDEVEAAKNRRHLVLQRH